MNPARPSRSTFDYGRKLAHSVAQGATSGREEFLHGRPFTPFLGESARHALSSAFVGACLGLLRPHPERRHKSAGRALADGVLGCAIGFTAGVAWESRRLAASMAAGAWKKLEKARDEHWLETHPIDYA